MDNIHCGSCTSRPSSNRASPQLRSERARETLTMLMVARTVAHRDRASTPVRHGTIGLVSWSAAVRPEGLRALRQSAIVSLLRCPITAYLVTALNPQYRSVTSTSSGAQANASVFLMLKRARERKMSATRPNANVTVVRASAMMVRNWNCQPHASLLMSSMAAGRVQEHSKAKME